jgi:hypothetical protein
MTEDAALGWFATARLGGEERREGQVQGAWPKPIEKGRYCYGV